MLRITVHEGSHEKTIRLEGRLMGPWVEQFNKVFREVAELLGSNKLKVDLCGLSHVGSDGRRALSRVHQLVGAEFVSDTPLTNYFAREASRLEQKPEGV